MKKNCLLVWAFIMLPFFLFAQDDYDWYKPSFVNGVCILDSNNIYHRLPRSMETEVRKPVWRLSLNTAGEFIRFKTTARNIKVKFVLANKDRAFPHMPEMGVSGVDLFALDEKGQWNWASPQYSFGDTAVFVYSNLYISNGNDIADFYLYLPLYNTIKSLVIGIPKGSDFYFVNEDNKKPVVAYGTSILQGAVASRAGLAWTNILGRMLNRTVINLGFSGNGHLDKPIFDLMSETNAFLYIIDCMPNMTGKSDSIVKARVYYGINKIRSNNPTTPILLVEDARGNIGFYMNVKKRERTHEMSQIIASVYSDLIHDGYKNIYLLTEEEIGFDINSTTEGSHPDDIGMMQYANAYKKKVNEILSRNKDK